ncbi:hypothetical protein H4J45_16570 [Colwellia sp. BRX10-6]|jgi:hypothetical protein|uniref:hypothetical protein n=1 Tax=unclassified Colwellia TaxID=196834 RepID=UPI0015F67161|nr:MULTISPECIES: hypothetical protein [unclassified Colwellia]MBA6385041.1 hypothetical protein [Colwellia sp. BRX10-9]MBA6395698.1 hypothetical protein [Colwellia sp. BRX10-6]
MFKKILSLSIIVFLFGGCAAQTDFTDGEPVDYVDLQKLHTWQTNPKLRTCKNLYKYDGLLIINTGQFWGFYNPETGLFTTGFLLPYRNEYRNQYADKLRAVHYFLKKDGLCAVELKIPVNRKSSRTRSEVYTQDPFNSYDLQVQKAMDTVYYYSGENLSKDLESELKIIERKLSDTNYQSDNGIGKVVSSHSYGWKSFEKIAAIVKGIDWEKHSTLNKKRLEAAASKKFYSQQSEYLERLNSDASNNWGNRKANNQNLSRGAKVCSFDNYYGFVEDIANDKVKVMWKGKVHEKVNGYFFGKINNYDIDSKVLYQINFETKPVNDLTWTSISNIAKCPFDFN